MGEFREPLATVPYDLVFLHLILPYTIHYFRPRTAAQQIGTVLWKWLSRSLRVSSYMFGERHPTEEVAPKGFFGTRPKTTTASNTQEPRKGGGWRRVPADNVAIVRGMRATVEVTEYGQLINETEARLLELQNAEAERHKRTDNEGYTVVHIPLCPKSRIIIFILAVWSVCCVAVAQAANRLDRHRQRRGNGSRASWPLFLAKQEQEETGVRDLPV